MKPITNHTQITDRPWMSRAEIEAIEDRLKRGMLLTEWGTGGGTIHFSRFVQHVRAIEHNPKYARLMRHALVDHDVANVTLEVVESSPRVNPTMVGPYPAGYEDAFKAYANAGVAQAADAFMVDGRSRLQCAQAASRVLAPGGFIFFHDYFAKGRDRYRVLEQDKTLKLVASITTGQSLAIFEKLR